MSIGSSFMSYGYHLSQRPAMNQPATPQVQFGALKENGLAPLIQVPIGGYVIAGGHPEADIQVVDDEYVNQAHCFIARTGPDTFEVRDLRSHNGTEFRRGDHPFMRITRIQVKPGDTLKIGETEFTIPQAALGSGEEEDFVKFLTPRQQAEFDKLFHEHGTMFIGSDPTFTLATLTVKDPKVGKTHCQISSNWQERDEKIIKPHTGQDTFILRGGKGEWLRVKADGIKINAGDVVKIGNTAIIIPGPERVA